MKIVRHVRVCERDGRAGGGEVNNTKRDFNPMSVVCVCDAVRVYHGVSSAHITHGVNDEEKKK